MDKRVQGDVLKIKGLLGVAAILARPVVDV